MTLCTSPSCAIYCGVFAVRCLPVRYPDHYISLRYTGADGHEHEVGLMPELAEWPALAQRLIRESLAKRYFVHTIFRIHRVELTNNYLDFSVDTDLGPQRFTLRWQSDWAHDYGSRGKMLLDTDENCYLIPDVEALSARERAMFERYIYW